jgi:hypothetical protein
MGAACVKWGDLSGGTTEASRMPDCTGMVECTGVAECIGMASRMVEPTGIVEDHAEMAESRWMPSGMAKATELTEVIVIAGTCWVVGAIGMAEASVMLVAMSISYTKNNWNIGETVLSITTVRFSYSSIYAIFTCNV